jgi:hypothetical protein
MAVNRNNQDNQGAEMIQIPKPKRIPMTEQVMMKPVLCPRHSNGRRRARWLSPNRDGFRSRTLPPSFTTTSILST